MNQPKREKAVRTKQNLVAAARDLFHAKGIVKTSVNEIVKRAGVAKGTFYLYFETKDDMVKAIIEENLDHFLIILHNLESVPVTAEAVDGIIDSLTGALKEHDNPLRMMHHARFFGYLNMDLMKVEFLGRFVGYIKSWLDRGVSSGLFDLQDTGFYAMFILASFHEMIDMAITDDCPFTFDELGFHMKSIIRKVIFKAS